MHTEKNAVDVGLTPTNSPKNLQTTTSQEVALSSIGTGLSLPGLETLRNSARANLQKPDAHSANRQILASLKQDLGSRLVIREKFNSDYEVTSLTATINGDVDDGWMKALEHYAKSGRGDLAAMEVTRLRSLTAKRKEGEFDLELSIGALTEELCEYPDDIVRTVCREWARKNKFFPVLKELIDECDKLMQPRLALLKASRNCIQIEHKPESEQETYASSEAISKMLGECLKKINDAEVSA